MNAITKLPSLYEVATEFAADAERLQEMDLDDQTLTDTLAGLKGTLELKAQNTAMVAKNLEALASAIKDAEGRLAERRKAVENRAAALRAYILRCMQHADIKKIESALFRLSIRANPATVVVDSAAAVPARFWRIPDPPPPTLDKQAIKEAIKGGEEVPGVHLEQGERLHID